LIRTDSPLRGILPRRIAPSMPTSPFKRRALTSLISTLVVVVLVDLCFSIFVIKDGMVDGFPLPPFGAITHVPRQTEFLKTVEAAESNRDSIGGFDQHLGWTYRPNKSKSDGSAHTNSLAARGRREYPAQPPAAVKRILAFGDSFIWCEEVSDHQTWEHIYEKVIPTSEVINFGVGGYGTGQAFLRYQEVGRELGADVVVIGLLLENIGRNVNCYRPMWSLTSSLTRTKPRFQLNGDELVLIPQPFETEAEQLRAVRDESVLDVVAEHEYWRGPIVPTGRASSLMRLAVGWFAYKARQPHTLWLAPEKEPYRVSVVILEQFHQMAMNDGASIAPVLIFPAREDLESIANGEDRYWKNLIADLEARGIPVLDLSIPLLERFQELAAQKMQHQMFSGYHLSFESNRIVAKELAQFIEHQNQLPNND
jgi:hypothetical protein